MYIYLDVIKVYSFDKVGLGLAADHHCQHHQHQAEEHGHRQLHGIPKIEVHTLFASCADKTEGLNAK